MKTTAYFEEQVLKKRPYLKRESCQRATENPVKKEIQDHARIRHWIYIRSYSSDFMDKYPTSFLDVTGRYSKRLNYRSPYPLARFGECLF